MNKAYLIQRLYDSDQLKLPRIDSWQPSAHSFDQDQRDAIEAALLAGRPLLVRGEPGLGKSQIARALAAAWQWRLVTAVIHSRTEVEDLLYQIDHVGRLSDANRRDAKNQLAGVDDYVQCGPVWKALQENRLPQSERNPEATKPGFPQGDGAYQVASDAGCVLLIDEIDKAHNDVPNALLEVLNSGEFIVPQTGETVRARHGVIIVITANDERSMPAAFMRRCAVLELTLGKNPKERLMNIAKAHVDQNLLDTIELAQIEKVAQYVVDYRGKVPDTNYRPGTSEMLDMLRVLNEYEPLTGEKLQKRLDTLGKFLVRKGFSSDLRD